MPFGGCCPDSGLWAFFHLSCPPFLETQHNVQIYHACLFLSLVEFSCAVFHVTLTAMASRPIETSIFDIVNVCINVCASKKGNRVLQQLGGCLLRSVIALVGREDETADAEEGVCKEDCARTKYLASGDMLKALKAIYFVCCLLSGEALSYFRLLYVWETLGDLTLTVTSPETHMRQFTVK